MSKQKRNIKFTVAAILVFIAVIVGAFVNRMLQPSYLTDEQLRLNGAFVLPKPRIIEPFELIDHDGKSFTLAQLENKWTLMFFGFTHCPDVCPATMSVLKKFDELMQGELEEDDYQVVLLSVDPARDTPEVLKPYVEYFNPDFTGVTGEFLSLQKLATNLSASFYKVPGGGENYQVDHSANIVLINPYGHYHGFYKPQLDPAKIKITFRSIAGHFKY